MILLQQLIDVTRLTHAYVVHYIIIHCVRLQRLVPSIPRYQKSITTSNYMTCKHTPHEVDCFKDVLCTYYIYIYTILLLYFDINTILS